VQILDAAPLALVVAHLAPTGHVAPLGEQDIAQPVGMPLPASSTTHTPVTPLLPPGTAGQLSELPQRGLQNSPGMP
jgi:hypothetical protein